MPAAGQSTFDGNPYTSPPITTPYRPGDPDFNGRSLVDSQVNPPDPGSMVTANLLNGEAAEIIALRRLIHSATVSAKYVAGSPLVDSFAAGPSSFHAQVPTAQFSIARTGGGAAAGDVTITWPANSLPPNLTKPHATPNGVVPCMIAVDYVTNGVRVVTQDKNGNGIDIPFTVNIR